MRFDLTRALILAGLLLPCTTARAATFCASTAVDLQAALTVAEDNGEDDVIRVRTGSYDAPDGEGFSMSYSEDHRIDLVGGYLNADCSARVLDPTNTVLRGSGGTVATIRGTRNLIVIEGFTFRDGVSESIGAGLTLNVGNGYDASAIVRSNIFRNNAAGVFGGGLSCGSNGELRILNNLFVENSAGGSSGAASLVSFDSFVYIDGNTVTNNTVTGGGAGIGGLRVDGSSTFSFSNNIFWGNYGPDLFLDEGTSILIRNDIETLLGTPTLALDNLAVDPAFEGGGSYRPIDESPVNDYGTNNPSGGVIATDLEGRPRIIGKRMDLGAYESNAILRDGFERGDTREWDSESP